MLFCNFHLLSVIIWFLHDSHLFIFKMKFVSPDISYFIDYLNKRLSILWSIKLPWFCNSPFFPLWIYLPWFLCHTYQHHLYSRIKLTRCSFIFLDERWKCNYFHSLKIKSIIFLQGYLFYKMLSVGVINFSR